MYQEKQRNSIFLLFSKQFMVCMLIFIELIIKNKINIMNSILKYGLGLGALLAVYFIIMNLVGLGQTLVLRLFNVVLIFGVVFYFLYKYKQTEEFDYFQGFFRGLQLTALGVITFAIFMGFYTTFDVAFLETIKQSEGLGRFINPFTIMIAIVMEGLGMGFLCTYTSMQFLQGNTLKKVAKHYQN